MAVKKKSRAKKEGLKVEVKLKVVPGAREDLGASPMIARMSRHTIKKLKLHPGLISLEGPNKKRVNFDLSFDSLSSPVKENEVAICADGREALEVNIGGEVTLIGQELEERVELNLKVIKSTQFEDIAQVPPIVRVSEKDLAVLRMYNNDLVKISAREHVLNVKVKTSGDVQPGEIAICKQEREKLGVDEGESISIRHFSEAEKAEYFSEILSKVDFLSTFPTRDLIKLAKNIRREEYRPEEVVCREHERGDSMYIIESGRVEVWIRTRRGNKRRIAFLERGSFFGEISLLTGQERTATVSCITPTILLVIEKKPFQEILLKNQTRVEQISEIINQRVRETSQKRKKAEAFEEEHLVSFQARKPTNLASRIKQFFGIK